MSEMPKEEGLIRQDIPVIDGELVEDAPSDSTSLENLKINNQEVLMKVEQTIPSGENLRVGTLMKSKIIVSPGSKLTVEEVAMKSHIVVKKGGAVEILGVNMGTEIINE